MMKNLTGQGYCFAALVSSVRYILCLSGTLSGGYASDVYHLLYRTHPQLMIEDNNQWNNPTGFISRYGVLERVTLIRQEDGLTTKAKKNTIVKQKPGISPLLLGRMLLSNSVFLRLSDCIEHMQPYEEDVVELAMGQEMAALYAKFEERMRSALTDALHRGDHSLLELILTSSPFIFLRNFFSSSLTSSLMLCLSINFKACLEYPVFHFISL